MPFSWRLLCWCADFLDARGIKLRFLDGLFPAYAPSPSPLALLPSFRHEMMNANGYPKHKISLMKRDMHATYEE